MNSLRTINATYHDYAKINLTIVQSTELISLFFLLCICVCRGVGVAGKLKWANYL